MFDLTLSYRPALSFRLSHGYYREGRFAYRLEPDKETIAWLSAPGRKLKTRGMETTLLLSARAEETLERQRQRKSKQGPTALGFWLYATDGYFSDLTDYAGAEQGAYPPVAYFSAEKSKLAKAKGPAAVVPRFMRPDEGVAFGEKEPTARAEYDRRAQSGEALAVAQPVEGVVGKGKAAFLSLTDVRAPRPVARIEAPLDLLTLNPGPTLELNFTARSAYWQYLVVGTFGKKFEAASLKIEDRTDAEGPRLKFKAVKAPAEPPAEANGQPFALFRSEKPVPFAESCPYHLTLKSKNKIVVERLPGVGPNGLLRESLQAVGLSQAVVHI